MLSDYIIMYSEALASHNDKEIRRIEKELKELGMDAFTAKLLVADYRKEQLNEGNN